MDHLCISIAWVEADSPESPWNELSRMDVPLLEVQPNSPSSETLEALEQQTLRIGQDLMRHLLSLQWDQLDQQQVEHLKCPPIFGPGAKSSILVLRKEVMMSANRRQYSLGFKAKVVLQVLAGEKTSSELCRTHKLHTSVLNR
jgi:hypothetical protein